MSALNITLVNLWPSGGMLHYTAKLSDALSKEKNINLTVVLPEDSDLSLFPSDIHLLPISIPSKLSVRNVASILTGVAFYKLYQAIQKTKPDIIHLNSSHPLLVLTLPILALKNSIVATVHDAVPHPGSDNSLRKKLERDAVIRHAKHFFVHREVIREHFLRLNNKISPSCVQVTPHGNFDFFAEFTNVNHHKPPEEPATLLFFGRISIYKGLIHLARAANLIRDKHPELKVIIAGEGKFEPEVRDAINDDLFEVHNRYISDEDVNQLFSRAKIIVLPYIEASESGVIKICKAFNKPVVSTDVGGIPESVKPNNTGIIVPPGDATALADAVDKLLTQPDLYERLVNNIRKEKDSLPDWKDASNIIAGTYQSIAAADPHR